MTSATASETPENPTKIMGRTVTPDQRKLGMLGGMQSLSAWRGLVVLNQVVRSHVCSALVCFSERGSRGSLWRLYSVHDLLGQVSCSITRARALVNEFLTSVVCIWYDVVLDSGALAMSHAILRDCPTICEEDELGFLSSDADQIADTV